MVKVQAKKATVVAKKPANKKTSIRSKPAPAKTAAAKKAAPKPAARKTAPSKPARVVKTPAKAAPKKALKKVARPASKAQKVQKVTKPAAKALAKSAKPAKGRKIAAIKPSLKKTVKVAAGKSAQAPAKASARTAPKKPAVAESTGKAGAKAPALKTVPAPASSKGVAKTPAVAAARPIAVAASDDKKRARRPRPRVQSNGAPVAAWLNAGEKPRPSSFIPAPARAEAPSLVAAPPASSDRLIRTEDLTDLAVRTVPVRIDVEHGGGRTDVHINPEEVVLRVGEGIEWDFRYFGGADVTIDEIVIEFEKPSPFAVALFRSRKPGPARPHRQLSSAAQASAIGKRFRYTVRAMNAFRTEMAAVQPWVTITA